MRVIALEEHFVSPAFLDGPGRYIKEQARTPASSQFLAWLSDLDTGRIAAMDTAGITVQVLSLGSPGVEQLDAAEAISVSRETNDYLAAAIRRHPERFVGLAALPTAAPAVAADELERAVRELGFRGALINGHTRGRYLDDQFFWPILERAETLQVPLYLHPTPPPQSIVETSYAGFAPEVTARLSTYAWGWHVETAIHVLRLVLGGVFDRYPRLQFVVGHMGEGLSFMLPRIERYLPAEVTKLQRSIGAYLRENLYYTFSGFTWTSMFLNLLLELGSERIMFSVDYPNASMVETRDFLERLPVRPSDKELIAHGNAERLLRL
ncbi:amidohydrolase [Ktedonosporobacter rubrisoli]|uniref:Amidohydrolase n=2 Tax=Ktedonosporobacter rubrisoli TaxID=2509675 RepID=A0A4P6K6J3_KTERU|nr:amidohydrolase [Ktedonosporobacter rubrisoli]